MPPPSSAADQESKIERGPISVTSVRSKVGAAGAQLPEEIGAAIILQNNAQLTKRELFEYASKKLAKFKIKSIFAFLMKSQRARRESCK